MHECGVGRVLDSLAFLSLLMCVNAQRPLKNHREQEMNGIHYGTTWSMTYAILPHRLVHEMLLEIACAARRITTPCSELLSVVCFSDENQ